MQLNKQWKTCDECGKRLSCYKSLWRHKKICRPATPSGGNTRNEYFTSSVDVPSKYSSDDTNSISMPLTPHTYRMDSGSGFSVPKRRYSVSERTKRPSLARLLEKVDEEEEQAEKCKLPMKRQCRMRLENSTSKNPIHTYINNSEEEGSDETDNETSNDGLGFVDSDGIIHTNLIETNMDDDEDSESSVEDSKQENENATDNNEHDQKW